MGEAYNIFISWSGPRSKHAAEALSEWLPLIIQRAQPWLSANNVDKGTRWREEVTKALDTVKAGIICLTRENLNSEWLLFEAGALSKTLDTKSRVWTYLLEDLEPEHVKDPLAMFQATKADKEDTRKLIHSINKNLDATVTETRLNYVFDKSWPDFENQLKAMPPAIEPTLPLRSDNEILAEILEHTRMMIPVIGELSEEASFSRDKRAQETALHEWLSKHPGGVVINTATGSVPAIGIGSAFGSFPDTLPERASESGPPSRPSEGTFSLPSRPLPSRKPPKP